MVISRINSNYWLLAISDQNVKPEQYYELQILGHSLNVRFLKEYIGTYKMGILDPMNIDRFLQVWLSF